MNLNDVHQGVKRHKKPKRLGRGKGTGAGKTSGRGHKGQGQCSGYSRNPVFESGATPLVRRIPKRGFNNMFALVVNTVNVGQLEAAFNAGDEVTPDSLKAKNLAKGRYDVLKILGDGELTKKLRISAHRFSKSAQEKIASAGGEIVTLSLPTPVEEKKQQKKQAKAGD